MRIGSLSSGEERRGPGGRLRRRFARTDRDGSRGRPAELRLEPSPDNPVPQGAVLVGVVAADGVGLRAVCWQPHPGKARPGQGTVCFIPGWAASIEKYYETVEDLLHRGYAVATLDWRSQGHSQRPLANPRKVHAGDFADYDRDFEAFFEQAALRHCPPPYAVLAHSMGGLLTLRAARREPRRFSRIALASPMLGLGAWGEATPLPRAIAGLAVRLGFGQRGAPLQEPFAGDRMPFWLQRTTGDRRRFARSQALLRTVPLNAVGSTTFGWLNAAFAALDASRRPDFAPAIGLPVLLATGGRDVVVSAPAIAAMARALPDARHIRIAEAHHDVLVERDAVRGEFFAAFDAFMAEAAR